MRLLFAEDQPQLRRSAREYALLELSLIHI